MEDFDIDSFDSCTLVELLCPMDDLDDDDYGSTLYSHLPSDARAKINAHCRATGKETPAQWRMRKIREADMRANIERKQVEAEEYDRLPVPEKSAMDFRLAMQQARCAKGMKRKDLARCVGVKASDIQSWESGKTKPTGPQRNKLNRALGTALPKK